MERFAQLRAANPHLDFHEIMDHIHDEELAYADASIDYCEILNDAGCGQRVPTERV